MVTLNCTLINFPQQDALLSTFGKYAGDFEYTADGIFRRTVPPFCPSCGAQMTYNGHKVINKSTGEEISIKADVIIGCDGFNSQVSKLAGVKKEDYVFARQSIVEDPDPPEEFEFYFSEMAPGGYFWRFPREDNKSYFGIVCLRSTTDIDKRLDRFIKRKGIRGKHKKVRGMIPRKVPDWINGRGILLAGDAEGYVHPIFYGGIGSAIRTGLFAGKVAKEMLGNNLSSDFIKERYEGLFEDFETEDTQFKSFEDLFKARTVLDKFKDEHYDILVNLLNTRSKEEVKKELSKHRGDIQNMLTTGLLAFSHAKDKGW